MEATLLYEGDQWLSNDSLVLMGIFTNQKKLRTSARKLIKERLRDNYDADEFGGTKTEFINHQMHELFGNQWGSGQTTDGEVRFTLLDVDINVLEEI